MTPQEKEVLVYPDSRLREVAVPVQDVETVAGLVADMLHTMYLRDAVGLAAPQIGELVRVFVLDGAYFKTPGGDPLVFINPEIVSVSDAQVRRREGSELLAENFGSSWSSCANQVHFPSYNPF